MKNVTLESFNATLDALLNANPHAKSKGDDFKNWCAQNFDKGARISHIREQRQTTNRVSEQFRYFDPIVAFVCDEEVKRDVLVQYISERAYRQLENVAIIGVKEELDANNQKVNVYTYERLLTYRRTDFTEWASNFFESVEPQSTSRRSGQSENDSESRTQVIYFGAPGTGKSHEVKIQTGELTEDDEEIELPNVFRTTFHPDTDYASFVGCYKPTMKPTTNASKTISGKVEEIVYEYVPQVFTDAYVYAYNHSGQPTYLVIEEINRGNCAQIFGDLFQLLDRKNGVSEYTIKADKDLAKYLREAKDEADNDILVNKDGIKDGKLRLPENLYIFATMNTSDQSLFPMDSAFKRRWEWEYVPINYTTDVDSGSFDITINGQNYPWVKFIEEVNKRIFALTQSEDKQMGNFFIKHSIGEKEFKSKVMFYLWYEVLRDETGNNKYFFKKVTEDNKDGLLFTFKDLYEKESAKTLQQFMEYLGVAHK